MPRNADLRSASVAILVAATALTGGCFLRGGPWYSGNAPLTYVSTAMSPKTVSVIDTRTGETVWSMDVPVDTKLVLQFEEDLNPGTPMPARLSWRVFDDREMIFGGLNDTIPAPPVSARRIDMSIRNASVAETTGG